MIHMYINMWNYQKLYSRRHNIKGKTEACRDTTQSENLSESEGGTQLSCQNNSRLKGLRYLCSNDTPIFGLSLLSKTVSKMFLEISCHWESDAWHIYFRKWEIAPCENSSNECYLAPFWAVKWPCLVLFWETCQVSFERRAEQRWLAWLGSSFWYKPSRKHIVCFLSFGGDQLGPVFLPEELYGQGSDKARGSWRATVHRVAKSWTKLSDWAHTHTTLSDFTEIWTCTVPLGLQVLRFGQSPGSVTC